MAKTRKQRTIPTRELIKAQTEYFDMVIEQMADMSEKARRDPIKYAVVFPAYLTSIFRNWNGMLKTMMDIDMKDKSSN